MAARRKMSAAATRKQQLGSPRLFHWCDDRSRRGRERARQWCTAAL